MGCSNLAREQWAMVMPAAPVLDRNMCQKFRENKQDKHTFFGPNFLQTFLALTARMSRGQKVSAGPKHGCLNVGAWSPQESGRKAPLFCNAAFSMLHCSFGLAAVQLLVKMTSTLQKSQCCSATSAAQRSENCSATSVFAGGMLQGWGFEGSCWKFLPTIRAGGTHTYMLVWASTIVGVDVHFVKWKVRRCVSLLEVPTVHWEDGKERGCRDRCQEVSEKALKPWIRGKNGAQTVN